MKRKKLLPIILLLQLAICIGAIFPVFSANATVEDEAEPTDFAYGITLVDPEPVGPDGDIYAVAPGKEIKIAISLDTIPESGMLNATSTFIYDPDVLTYVSYDIKGNVFNDDILILHQGKNKIKFSAVDPMHVLGNLNPTVYTEAGLIATLTFKVANDFDGSTEVSADLQVGDILLPDQSFNRAAVPASAILNVIGANHKHTEKTVPAVPATCSDAGKSELVYCTVCGKIIKESKTEPALGHDYGAWTDDGDGEHHSQKCLREDNTITKPHDWKQTDSTPATHTENGVINYECTTCGAKKSETIDKITDHSYGQWKSDDENTHSRTCECGDKETKPHAWNNGEVTTPATHTTAGVKTYTCNDCGAKKTEAIEKTSEHKFGDWKSDGETTHSASCECGEKKTEEHTFGDWEIVKNATQTETGSKKRSCTACGYEETEVIPVAEGSPKTGDTMAIIFLITALAAAATTLVMVKGAKRRK